MLDTLNNIWNSCSSSPCLVKTSDGFYVLIQTKIHDDWFIGNPIISFVELSANGYVFDPKGVVLPGDQNIWLLV